MVTVLRVQHVIASRPLHFISLAVVMRQHVLPRQLRHLVLDYFLQSNY